jgi:hypothetical protein
MHHFYNDDTLYDFDEFWGEIITSPQHIMSEVIPMMKVFNGTLPVFEATEDYVKTTLFRTTLNPNQ